MYAKKKDAPEMLCPECRTPCPVPLRSLPCNVILNRILEAGMSAKKSQKLQVGVLGANYRVVRVVR